jgi:hypothetical protein
MKNASFLQKSLRNPVYDQEVFKLWASFGEVSHCLHFS